MAEPKDSYAILHYRMVKSHQTFKLGYDNILSLLDNPPMEDLANFLGYVEAWLRSLQDHHDAEENIVFPFLNTKLDFSNEILQHEIVHTGLDKMTLVINAARADLATFDPGELEGIMLELKEPLFTHLDEEVIHIAPSNLRVFDENELRNMLSEMITYAKYHGDPFLALPFMRSHTPPEDKDIWPALPWILRKVIIPYVLAMRYYGYWKYAPYAMS